MKLGTPYCMSICKRLTSFLPSLPESLDGILWLCLKSPLSQVCDDHNNHLKCLEDFKESIKIRVDMFDPHLAFLSLRCLTHVRFASFMITSACHVASSCNVVTVYYFVCRPFQRSLMCHLWHHASIRFGCARSGDRFHHCWIYHFYNNCPYHHYPYILSLPCTRLNHHGFN